MSKKTDAIAWEGLRYAVSREITCKAPTRCGSILDTKRAVLFRATRGENTGMAVWCGACFDHARPVLERAGVTFSEIDDGRTITPTTISDAMREMVLGS